MPKTPKEPKPEPNPSRRSFFRVAGVAGVAGLAAGGAAGGVIGANVGARNEDTAHGFDPLPARSEPGFDHVVVLMFENRSFDNLLGNLYIDGGLAESQTFDGLNTGTYTNKAPDGTVVEAHVYQGATDFVMRQPDPDPGEHYPHVNTQLFGVIDPASNEDLWKNAIAAPFNAPKTGAVADMSGFVHDYIVNYKVEKKGAEPTLDEYRVAMGSFSAEMLPVVSALAKGFAVYDSWFAAVPSQTFCNRSFFHASTSHGFVTNQDGGGYRKWIDAPAAPTIFNRLEEAGISWRVYYDEEQLVSLTGMLHAPVLEKYWKSNFRSMVQFHEDAKNGKLPAYAFIEPRMVFNHNDMHPPFGHLKEDEVAGQMVYDSALSDVRAGELLLSQVYTSLRNAASPSGSSAMNTVFVVTFDEHGGTFDHVAPPAAVPPAEGGNVGEMGFTFDRLGCRVPAIVISPYVREGSVINEEMHHASVISTLNRIHGLAPLSRRDDTAPDIFNSIQLRKPRQPALWPTTHPAYVPPNPESTKHPGEAYPGRKLSPPGKGLLGILLAKYDPDATVPETYGDAYEALRKHGNGLFGGTEGVE